LVSTSLCQGHRSLCLILLTILSAYRRWGRDSKHRV
jgi:hypothetical protein